MNEKKIENENAMCPACMSVNNKGIWFINAMFPVLYFYDFKEKRVNWYKVIPKCPKREPFLFLGIYEYEDKLFLIPGSAEKVVVYNKSEESFYEIEFANATNGNFRGGVCVDGILYCIPYKHNKVIGIDTVTCKAVQEIEWKKKNNLTDDNYINAYALSGDWLLAVVPKTNTIIKYNLRKGMWDSFKLGDVSNSYAAVGCINDTAYIFEINNSTIYSCKVGEKEINNSIQINSKGIKLITECNFFIADNVYDDKWILINGALNVVRENEYTYRNIKQDYATSYHYACWGKKENGKLIGIDNYNHIIEVDLDGRKKEEILYVDNTLLEKSLFHNDKINGKGIYNEKSPYSLQLFLDRIERSIDL